MATLAERRKENKREVKTIERFSTKDYEKEVIEGEGKALNEIAEIKANFKSMKKVSDMAEFIHNILYGTKGQQDVRKKEIMAFKGIKGKDEEETKEILERKKKYLEKQRFANLIELCRLFCLAGAAKEMTKEKYAEEIVKFLEKPGTPKVVVTEKDKVAKIEEEDDEEEEAPKKKPTTRAKKTETKKVAKKPAKKETKKPAAKKGAKKTATPKKTTAKKETKATPKKTTTKKTEAKEEKKPVKKATEKKETKATPKKGCCKSKKEAK